MAIEEAWLAAVADAELAEDECLLYLMDGAASAKGIGAWYVKPGFQVVGPDHVGWPAEVRPLLAEIDSADCIGAHRVFVWRQRTLEGIAALVRHELEHAQQFPHGPIGELLQLTMNVLAERLGGLRGGGRAYAIIPAEADANGAAATFVRRRYGADRIDFLLDADDVDASAFRSLVGPGPKETLADRMICFLAAIRDLCERYADRHGWPGQFERLASAHAPGTGDRWREIVGP